MPWINANVFPAKNFFKKCCHFWIFSVESPVCHEAGSKNSCGKKEEGFFKKVAESRTDYYFTQEKIGRGKEGTQGKKYLFKHQLAPLKRRRREKKTLEEKKKKTWFISIQLGDHLPRFRNFFWGQFRASSTGGGGGRGGLRILFTPSAGWRQVFLCVRERFAYLL